MSRRPASGRAASGRGMGWPNWRYAVVTASSDGAAAGTVFTMADARHNTGMPDGGVLLTQADFDALVHEPEVLRSEHRSELAGRLREARAFGTSSENDDLLAAFEESAVDDARVAMLEELVRLAVVVENSAVDGAVTPASPVGRALWGARPGDVVRVELPNGRDRTLRVLDVRHGSVERAA